MPSLITMDSKQKYANLLNTPAKTRRSSRPCILVLLVYVAVLLTASVTFMGFVAWKHHSNKPSQDLYHDADSVETIKESGMRVYDMFLEDTVESVGVDTEAEVEMVSTDYLGTQVTTYLDFKRSMGTFYVSEWGECYMVGGLDSRFIRPQELVNFLDDTKDRQLHGSKETVTYEKAADYPIEDPSLLPRAMRASCADKPLYWLRQIDTPPEVTEYLSHRDKRAVSAQGVRICLGVCISVGRAGNQ